MKNLLNTLTQYRNRTPDPLILNPGLCPLVLPNEILLLHVSHLGLHSMKAALKLASLPSPLSEQSWHYKYHISC